MDVHLSVGSVHDQVFDLLGIVLVGSIQGKAELLRHGFQQLVGEGPVLSGGLPALDGDGAPVYGQASVGDQELGIELHAVAQAQTVGAGAEGIVEGKAPGLDLGNGGAAVGAGKVLAELAHLAPHHVHLQQALRQGQGVLHGVRQSSLDAGADHQTVHYHLDAVLEVLVQPDLLGDIVLAAVYAQTGVARLSGPVDDLGVLALAAPDHRRQDLEAGPFGQAHDLVHHLVHALAGDLPAAVRAVGDADPGVEKTEVVVDLRHRAHRGTGVAVGGFLVYGNGRGEAVDLLHVGLLHLAQELPGVGGQGLHVAPLALRVDGVEGQGGLSAARKARQHHQLVPGDLQVYVL